jgi:hypothetical protein
MPFSRSPIRPRTTIEYRPGSLSLSMAPPSRAPG